MDEEFDIVGNTVVAFDAVRVVWIEAVLIFPIVRQAVAAAIHFAPDAALTTRADRWC